MRYVLGIETSCDDTSIAIVDENRTVIAMETVSQINVHTLFGGVIPEIAARNHVAYIFPVLDKVLKKSGMTMADISCIAVTSFPGLVGSLLVGVSAAKGLAIGYKKPLVAVNHLEGHINSAFLERDVCPESPYLSLIVSGGHTSLMSIDGDTRVVIGETTDDAAGEAYDKIAKMAGLGYPGGPVIDELAKKGDATKYNLPYLLKGSKHKSSFAFSYSGLKSAVKRVLDEQIDNLSMPDLMAAFQSRVVELIDRRVDSALSERPYKAFVVAGGVAANSAVRLMAEKATEKFNISLYIPKLKYCQDNGAMIAAAALKNLKSGNFDPVTFNVSPTVRPKR